MPTVPTPETLSGRTNGASWSSRLLFQHEGCPYSISEQQAGYFFNSSGRGNTISVEQFGAGERLLCRLRTTKCVRVCGIYVAQRTRAVCQGANHRAICRTSTPLGTTTTCPSSTGRTGNRFESLSMVLSMGYCCRSRVVRGVGLMFTLAGLLPAGQGRGKLFRLHVHSFVPGES